MTGTKCSVKIGTSHTPCRKNTKFSELSVNRFVMVVYETIF